MKNHNKVVARFLVCTFFTVSGVGINQAYAEINSVKSEQTVAANKIHGKVTDVLNASVYTYAEVDTGEMKVWAAGPVSPIKKGDTISFSTRMPMKNFHSETMKRDFSVIYFVDNFETSKTTTAGMASEAVSPHSQIMQKQAVKQVKGLTKVKGGNTIAEIYADKKGFKGKTVKVRGKVIKFNSNILGKNWLHIMDSSTQDDLTVTTSSSVAIDDVVVVEGVIELEKDFGYGYVYPVIMEDAKLTKE